MRLNEEIGTAKDNRSSPVHDWYRFTAGFSYKLVDTIIKEENLNRNSKIYESFAGCGTTLVSAQKHGIPAVGNEAQELLYDVINAKLNWNIDEEDVLIKLKRIKLSIKKRKSISMPHELLQSLYLERDLFELYSIRDYILNYVSCSDTKLFLKLALTQTLHKVSVHPISIPYISRSRVLSNKVSGADMFEQTVYKMLNDLKVVNNIQRSSSIYLHDSREKNKAIESKSCDICITSPPYLNNLDYGEVSKVCSHFYDITQNWNDITEKVRMNLVTGATTHYKESEFNLDDWKKNQFYLENKRIVEDLFLLTNEIKSQAKKRNGKKTFDILALYYFQDMYRVLIETKRVLTDKGKAYLVLGDSAPYGVFINTTEILGQIAKNIGFEKYNIVKIRERGTKWKTLKNRHSLTLSENILILE